MHCCKDFLSRHGPELLQSSKKYADPGSFPYNCIALPPPSALLVHTFLPSPLPLQLRREKIDLENTLEQEQEMLVNKLWKKMDRVEAEKRWVSRLISYIHGKVLCVLAVCGVSFGRFLFFNL